jgi:hypothetical protein
MKLIQDCIEDLDRGRDRYMEDKESRGDRMIEEGVKEERTRNKSK